MKYILILTIIFISACSEFDADIENIKDMGKQEIVTSCQVNGAFTYGILQFSCEQLFVVEE
tara:strand:+ start:1275 stop:1457 length:183 start_codon:yes stop_codon:yes gene_type:complete